MHGNKRGQEEPFDGWEGQRGVTGEEGKMTTAGPEHEIEEEE